MVVGSWVAPLFAMSLFFLVLKEKLTVLANSGMFLDFFMISDLIVERIFLCFHKDKPARKWKPKILCERPDNYVNDISVQRFAYEPGEKRKK